MCDPLTIGSLVLSGASYAANAAAQSKVESARNGAMAAERIRQQGYDREAKAINTRAQDRYQDFEGQQENRTGKLTEMFNAQNAERAKDVAEGPSETMPASQSNIVTQESEKQLGKAKAFADQQGTALAGMRSFGDLLGELSLGTGRDAGYVGQIGGFKRGSSNVLSYELEAANQKGGGMKMLGDVLGGLGSMGLNAGLSKNVGPAAVGAGAATTSAVPSMARASAPAPMSLGYGSSAVPVFARTSSLFNPYGA